MYDLCWVGCKYSSTASGIPIKAQRLSCDLPTFFNLSEQSNQRATLLNLIGSNDRGHRSLTVKVTKALLKKARSTAKVGVNINVAAIKS